MADERTPATDAPRQLLAATQEFTRRVRKAQRGTWFPLVLLGLVVVAAAPFYRLGSREHVTCSPLTVTHSPGGGLVRTCYAAYGWPAFSYWTIALALAYVVIAGFYVLRARRRGVGARIAPYVTAGIAGLILVAALWLVQRHLGGLQSRYQAALVVHGLNPLLAIGVALLVSFYSIDRLLSEHSWVVARQWIFLPGLWLAGGVLLLGGAAFAIAERLRK